MKQKPNPVQVFLTLHTAYYVRDRICIGARDRESGDWQTNHPAIGRRLDGGIFVSDEGDIIPHDNPEPGDRLCFGSAHDVVITSGLIATIDVSDAGIPTMPPRTPLLA